MKAIESSQFMVNCSYVFIPNCERWTVDCGLLTVDCRQNMQNLI